MSTSVHFSCACSHELVNKTSDAIDAVSYEVVDTLMVGLLGVDSTAPGISETRVFGGLQEDAPTTELSKALADRQKQLLQPHGVVWWCVGGCGMVALWCGVAVWW